MISNPRNIQIDNFDYELPDDRIAKYPLAERDSSKLLVYKKGEIIDEQFSSIPDYLPQDSLMVFNNTKVIQARLQFQKETGAKIEIFCLEPFSPADYLMSFQQTEHCSWLCLVGNSKKWKEGKLIQEINIGGKNVTLSAERLERVGDSSEIRFSWNDSSITFADILDAVGELPIPPYLNRKTEESDINTYQTVYSKIIGSVAAPTAGLHFTPKVLANIESKGIVRAEVTLHVGAGTFKPVQASEIGGHDMHSELISVKKETIELLLAQKTKKVVAVGTTSVRTLESLYYLGVLLGNDLNAELFVPQWLPYENEVNLTMEESLINILHYLNVNQLDVLVAHTAIMIAPSYQYKIVNAIVTNFHQPKSTLLLLVSAFTKADNWKHIYNHALENGYRFLSYGDSSLLLNE